MDRRTCPAVCRAMVTLSALTLATLVPAGASGAETVPGGRDCMGESPTVVGTAGADRLVGTAADDVFAAGRGDDVVIGKAGDDVVCAGPGDDLVEEGAGRDAVALGAGADEVVVALGSPDRLDGGSGTDRLDYSALEDPGEGVVVDLRSQRSSGRAGRDTVERFDVVTGTGGDDVLAGSSSPESLGGGPGADRLVGRGGADRLLVDFAPDDARGGGGDDTIAVLAHDFTQGPDSYIGGPGRDLLSFARAYSEPGLVVDLRVGTVRGLGHDSVSGIEDVTGTDLRGDTLTGDAGPNVLTGLGGGDTLVGRGGVDTADGGSGSDSCAAEAVVDCES